MATLAVYDDCSGCINRSIQGAHYAPQADSATFGHGICPDCHKKIVAPEREYLDPKGKTRAVGGFDPCEMARDVTRTCLPG